MGGFVVQDKVHYTTILDNFGYINVQLVVQCTL
jgi:hypothetical protein